MSIKEYLDYCISNYYQKVIDKYNFKLVESYFEGMGALYTFQNESFRLRVVNDRGTVDSVLASLSKPGDFTSLVFILMYIRLNGRDIKSFRAWKIRKLFRKEFSCEEEAAILDNHYTQISELLSPEKYNTTREAFARLATEQIIYLYGRPK